MPQYKYRALLLVLVISVMSIAATVGCGSSGAASSGSQSASPSPTPVPAPAPSPAGALAVTPTAVNFGSVAIGSSKTSTVTLSNTAAAGGASITVSQISVTGAVFKMATGPALPLTLAAGKSSSVTITFTPTTAGSASGSLSILAQGSSSPIVAGLSGNGLAPNQLGISPTAINFGNVIVGSSVSQTASLTAGGSNISVSSAAWNGLGYSVSGITFPVTVPAGQSVPFTVTFTPQTAGSSSGSVSFVSNAANSPTVATLAGAGVQQHSASLSWNPSTSTVAGYKVYRGTQSGGPYALISASLQAGTSYTDNTVQSGQTYFYVVTAVDASSQESVFSNEVLATIPTP